MEQTSGGDAVAAPKIMSSPPTAQTSQPSLPHASPVCDGAGIANGTRGPIRANELFQLQGEDGNSKSCTAAVGTWVTSWQQLSKEDAGTWVSKGITFYTIHAACFALVIGMATLLLWLSPKRNNMSFINALYNAASAVSVTGLMSIDIRSFSGFDQFTLLVSMLLGSHIFTSLVPLYVRQIWLSATLRDCHCIQNGDKTQNLSSRTLRRRMCAWETDYSSHEIPPRLSREQQGVACEERETTLDTQKLSNSEREDGTASRQDQVAVTVEMLGPSAQVLNKVCLNGCAPVLSKDQLPVFEIAAAAEKFANQDETSLQDAVRCYPSSCASCSSCARMHLELKALRTLGWIIPLYFLGFLVLGFLVVQLYLGSSPSVSRVPRENQVHPTVFAIFSSVSAMTNGGFSLLEDSMVPLQRSGSFLLISFGCLILLGNTMFAPTLRLIIWLNHRWAKGSRRLIYRFLLENPRDCYTHLFPQKQTIWLVITFTGFNVVEIFVFCLLEWKSRAFNSSESAGNKLLVAAFQALNSRTAGMNVVDLINLTPPMLILYLGMMYIAAYPVFISRQSTHSSFRPPLAHSNGTTSKLQQPDTSCNSKMVLISRSFVARDSLVLFISLLVICFVENRRMQEDPINFSIFNILFEVISAYTNVGLSLGYSCSLRTSAAPCTDVSYSFSGTWRSFNKLIIVMVMFFGRHRALPDNLDRAISLPSRRNCTMGKPISEHAGRLKHRRFHDTAKTTPFDTIDSSPGHPFCW